MAQDPSRVEFYRNLLAQPEPDVVQELDPRVEFYRNVAQPRDFGDLPAPEVPLQAVAPESTLQPGVARTVEQVPLPTRRPEDPTAVGGLKAGLVAGIVPFLDEVPTLAQDLEEARAEFPKLFLTGQIAGTLAPGGASLAAAKKILKPLTRRAFDAVKKSSRAKRILTRSGVAVAEGAVAEGLFSALSLDEPTPEAVAVFAAVDAALPAIGPAIRRLRGGRKLTKTLKKPLPAVDPEVEKAKLVTRLEAEKAQKEARVVIRKEAAQRVEQAIKAEGQLDKATVSRAIGIRTGRELPQLEQPSGIRKADVAADRELLGMSDIPSPEKQDFFKWQRAAIDQGIPERANALVDEVLEKPRGFTKVESAGVATRLQELKLEYEATARRAISLEKKAKGKPLLDPEVQEAAADVVRLEAEMDKLHHALRASGTENARNLVAQKFTINRTFDLATSIVRARGMKGAKLTAKERAKVVRATVKLQKNETALQTGLVKARAKEAAETIKVGSSRFRKMTPEARQRSMDDMVERAKRLIKEGCSVIG